MKRFISYNILFFFPIILIGLFAEILLRKIPNDYSYKRTYLDSNSKNITVLILGNSHAFYGLDPQYFKLNCFNASNVSQSLDYDYEILKKYNSKLNNLKYIILPLDNFSLYFDLKKSIEPWRVKNYEIYYDIHLSNSIRDKAEILSNNFGVNAKRLYNFYIKDRPGSYSSRLGWGKNYNSSHAQNLILSGKTAAERHHILTDEYLTHNVLILTDIIKLAKARKIKVIIYTSPAYKTYVKYANKNQMYNTINIIKSLSEKYSNISYHNWFTDQSFLFTDFYDGDHLNEIGAKKFSIKMDSVITTLNDN
jgi:hypothetical protein